MARANILNKLYLSSKSLEEFNWDFIQCPLRIENVLNYTDIMDIHNIIHSIKYMGNAMKRTSMIDDIMRKRNFRKFHAGTNRMVYVFLDDKSFVAKVPIDGNGEEDNLAEYQNQFLLQPFCTKMFQCTNLGTVSFSERVQPITSREEFASIANDIFNLITYKIVGKYVVDDIGASRFMNYGIRSFSVNTPYSYPFGPVLLDYPKVFKLDGSKLYCTNDITGHICNGEIDYDDTFDHLRCTVCGTIYNARDLSSEISDGKIKIINKVEGDLNMKIELVKNGQVILSSCDEVDNVLTAPAVEADKAEELKGILEPVDDYDDSEIEYVDPSDPNIEYSDIDIDDIESITEVEEEKLEPEVTMYTSGADGKLKKTSKSSRSTKTKKTDLPKGINDIIEEKNEKYPAKKSKVKKSKKEIENEY